MAELVYYKPFDHKAKSEFLRLLIVVKIHTLLEKHQFYLMNLIHLFLNLKKNFVDLIFIKKREYKKINFVSTNKKLKRRNLDSLYNKFCYEYQNKEFIIFTKVEYLNFDLKNKRKEYVQPIYGYVPFLKDKKIFIGYFVSYIEKERKVHLEFRLRIKEKINKYLPLSNNFFKK